MTDQPTSDTPETDAAAYYAIAYPPHVKQANLNSQRAVVLADHARDLERRLDRLKVELEQVKKERSEAEYDLQMTQVMAEANITTAGRERREAKEWADKCEASQRAWQENHAKALREVDFVRTKNEELEAWARELIEERNKLSTELDQLRKRAEEAERWKSEALQVEREWDPQELAKMLGGTLGESCRMVVQREVPRLLSELDRLRKEVERLREDKERLDWLSENVRQNEGLAVGGYWYRSKLRWQETRLRAAIDAAMSNPEKQ